MKLVCAWCEQEFERPSSSGPIPKYCRQSHRQRAHEVRQTLRMIESMTTAQLETVGLQRIPTRRT